MDTKNEKITTMGRGTKNKKLIPRRMYKNFKRILNTDRQKLV